MKTGESSYLKCGSQSPIRKVTAMQKSYMFSIISGLVMLVSAAYAQAQDGVRIDPARAAAIRECSSLAQRYPETTFASAEFEIYRACMARHGQVE